jgi:hypothetical protein
LGKLYKYIR